MWARRHAVYKADFDRAECNLSYYYYYTFSVYLLYTYNVT